MSLTSMNIKQNTDRPIDQNGRSSVVLCQYCGREEIYLGLWSRTLIDLNEHRHTLMMDRLLLVVDSSLSQ